MSEHTNRLIDETSPYLLQHAHNPVDWYPWGEEALALAKQRDKPILLSIGYAACHWCHVMERESFENEATARIMNDNFVCIKVDREERPDIDEIYMAATVAMSGSGGWPMTVFLTPDGHEPFFAGTYFPPDNRYGRPGFPALLQRIAELWQRDRDTLVLQGKELAEQVRREAEAALPASVGEAAIDAAASALWRAFDPTFGGFGGAPKFPPSKSLELLLRHHRRTGDERSLAMVRATLDGMARGGMYDHLGGGFARYSTDERWLVPHFEKMLYDNALLSRVYAQSYQVGGSEDDARVARETLDYILREMTNADGVFFSATDADSEGVEGKFFVWTPEEVEAVLPPDQARALCAYYDVTPQGNWEGHSILHTPRPLGEVARELGLEPGALRTLLAAAKAKLYAARNERVPPLCDDKVLTGHNALMIGSLAECGRILDEPRYRDAAARAADWLWQHMRRPDGGLYRTTRAGKTHLDAYLEDYAYACDAFIDVYEATGAGRHLARARTLAERMIADFADDEAGGFFNTARDHEALLVRMRPGQDGAIPSANAIAAQALLRLAWYGEEAWRERASDAIRAHGKLIERAPRAFAASLCVIDMLLEGPTEAVLVGDDGALAAAVGRVFLPNRIIAHLPGDGDAALPDALTAGKTEVGGLAALYVCRNYACERPVTGAGEVAAVLAQHHQTALSGRGKRVGTRLPGRATAAGTARYADRHVAALASTAYAALDGLRVGRIGFGGYRIDDGEPLFADALQAALRGGCNLVDTSTNYTDGGSERLVGATLAALIAAGELARDEIVVVSKIGYVQGQNLELAERRVREGKPFADMVKYGEGLWHCISPEWLDDQLERSLDRLGLETLDVCLLHNPEYFLSHAAKHGGVSDATRDAFYARIERAFAVCEARVADGTIGAYGVSSNTVGQRGADATELERFLACAERAGGAQHHFRVLQLPLNLFESQPALGEPSLLARAREKGVAVLANRPLNAIVGEQMLRLADQPELPPASSQDVDRQLQRLRALESRFAGEVAPSVALDGVDAADLFGWGERLRGLEAQLGDTSQLEQVVRGQVLPIVSHAFSAVERAIGGSARDAWTRWRGAYIRELERAFAVIRARVAERVASRLAAVGAVLDASLPLARHGEPLARKALWVLASTPGVTAVLLGMRRPPYVDDALAVMAWQPLARWREVYEGVRADLGTLSSSV